MTPAEYEARRLELDALRCRHRSELPRLLREARTYVASDATEETVQIREDFAFVERRIAALEALLRRAVVTDAVDGEDVVRVGSHVTVEYAASGRRVAYVIDGIGGGATGTISAGSPVGQALLGRRRGEVVTAVLPTGRSEQLRVLEVGSAPESRAA